MSIIPFWDNLIDTKKTKVINIVISFNPRKSQHMINQKVPTFCYHWLYRTNHKDIGIIYFVFGIMAGILGGILRLIIRTELQIEGRVITYNVTITAHGFIIIFFFIMPILLGCFRNWLIPIMLGCNDMAFPRLNNFSFWLILFRLGLLILRMFASRGVGRGWTLYPPLSSLTGLPGNGLDLAIFRIHVAGVSRIGSSLNSLCTIINLRIKAISWSKIPLFIWRVYFTSILLVLSLPVFAGALTTLLFDRHFNTSFFDPNGEGDLELYVKIFSWLSTIHGTNSIHHYNLAIFWAKGFIFLFTVGGLAEVMLASTWIDIIPHDSYYVVAQFHFVLRMGTVLTIIISFIHFSPIFLGIIIRESVGKMQFWLISAGVNLTFFPQHLLIRWYYLIYSFIMLYTKGHN